MTDTESYRFTNEDELAATDAMIYAVKEWNSAEMLQLLPADANRTALARIGAEALGCTFDDLRPHEIDALRAIAGGTLSALLNKGTQNDV